MPMKPRLMVCAWYAVSAFMWRAKRRMANWLTGGYLSQLEGRLDDLTGTCHYQWRSINKFKVAVKRLTGMDYSMLKEFQK